MITHSINFTTGCYGQGSRTDTDDQPAERAMSVTLNRCIIALLENPESGEVISPGMCIEVESNHSLHTSLL